MYQFSYAEVLEDDQTAARRVEGAVLDRAVALLNEAAADPQTPRKGIEALHLTRELWTAFVGALAEPDNALPLELRSNLVSIGIWVLKESDAIRLGRSTNYAGIADVCATIRDGLR